MKYYIIIALYFLTFLSPTFGAVDIIGPQWFFLSVLTTLSIVFLFKEVKNIQFNIVFLFVILFLTTSLITFLYTINIQESLITFLRLVVVFASLFVFYICLKNTNSSKTLLYFILIFFSIEFFYTYSHLINNYSFGDLISRDREFAGLAANVNIGAFSTLYKLPLLFWIFLTQKKYYKIIAGTYISLSIFSIFLTGSRGAVLALIFCVITLFIYAFFSRKIIPALKISLFVTLPILIFFIGFNPINEDNNIVQRISNFSDSSTSNRLSLYLNSIDFALENPFGAGLGTYKITSIPSDLPNMKGYQVAYHNHNDFLQYATEIGIIGSILYLFIFLSVLFLLFKSFVKEFKPLTFFLFISIVIFLGDSLINFPYSRPIQMIQVVFLIAFALIYINKNINKFNYRFNHLSVFLLTFLFSSIFSNFKVFQSFKEQLIMLSSFNANKFPQSDFLNLEEINYTYPNLTVTGLPIASLVSLYYMGEENYEKGVVLNRNNSDINPYLGFTEHAQSRIFYASNHLDSAYYYARIAFEKFPNNQAHSSTFQQILERLSKFDELENMFIKIKDNHVELEWSNYLKIISEKDDFNTINIEYAKEALLLFPESEDIYNYSNYIIYGKKNVFKSVELNLEANEYFKNKEFEKAIELWREALDLTPYETAFHENITRSYIGLMKFQEAIDYILTLDEKIINDNVNYFYFLGVAYLNINDMVKACENLRKSAKRNNKNALALVNSYCN